MKRMRNNPPEGVQVMREAHSEPDNDDRIYCAMLVMSDRHGKVTLETDEHLSPAAAIAALAELATMLKVSAAPASMLKRTTDQKGPVQ